MHKGFPNVPQELIGSVEKSEKKRVLSKITSYGVERFFNPAKLETRGAGIFNVFEEERPQWQSV